jgi:ATP-dependent DNA helicase RecG
MNIENQNIEFKETWRDEFLKTIAAFANTSGGTMFIGINDNGKIVGVENSVYLLENLPNKIIQKLSILAEVN